MTLKPNSTALNILRVYAAALVFLCHSTIVAEESFGIKWEGLSRLIITPAWGGVWIFLVIGGFLAAYGFDSQKYSLNKEGILKYYKGRFVKVLLPTWVFLTLMYVFNMQESNMKLTTLLRYLTCTHNGSGDAGIMRVGASWYVFIIMWLYLLVPLLLKGLYWFETKYKGHEYKGYLGLLAVLCGVGVLWRGGGIFCCLNTDIQFITIGSMPM